MIARWRLVHIGILLLFVGCASVPPSGKLETPVRGPSAVQEEWGVKDFSLRMTESGYILDFRYRVTDPDRARPLFDSRIKPYLVDDATGERFYVPDIPKVGSLRTTRPPKADKVYFILFGNPGKYLKQGSRVTVVIGEFRAAHLVVQ